MRSIFLACVLFFCTSNLFAAAADIMVLGLFHDMVILRVGEAQIKLRKGQTSPQGIKLISAESDFAVLEIDGKRKRYKLGRHISTGFAKSDKAHALIARERGMYKVQGFVNRQPVEFLVDTGATWVAFSSVQARKLGIDYIYEGTPGWAATASGRARFYKIKLKSIQIGEIVLHNIEAGVLEGNSPDTALLGMSFLNRVNIKHEGQLLRLEQKW